MTYPEVTREQVFDSCQEMLQKELYVVFTTPVDGMEPVMKMLEEHLEFQVDLEKRGIMFGAGPFFTDDGATWNGEGMVIIRADSMEEARKIAESDPMHKSGTRSFRIRPWLLNEGTVTINLTYSDGGRVIT